jgi:hypothetical protein
MKASEPREGTMTTASWTKMVGAILPAPKDADFSLYVRAYWPKAAITDGSWTPPPVTRAQ